MGSFASRGYLLAGSTGTMRQKQKVSSRLYTKKLGFWICLFECFCFEKLGSKLVKVLRRVLLESTGMALSKPVLHFMEVYYGESLLKYWKIFPIIARIWALLSKKTGNFSHNLIERCIQTVSCQFFTLFNRFNISHNQKALSSSQRKLTVLRCLAYNFFSFCKNCFF